MPSSSVSPPRDTRVAGLRSIALFEAGKGVLVLLAGFGLLGLLHRDVAELAEHLVGRLHLNPTHHMASVFLRAASHVDDAKLWALAATAAAYSIVRFIEAYGLWHTREWAEWFALLSGALYLPWEIFELLQRATPLRAGLLVVNVAVLLYLLWLRRHAPTRKLNAAAAEPTGKTESLFSRRG